MKLCVFDGSVFQTWEALTEKADWLKVLFLRGTIQSPLMADLVDLLPYVWVFCLTKILSGGGARPCRILNTRHASVYCTRFSQLRNSCFLSSNFKHFIYGQSFELFLFKIDIVRRLFGHGNNVDHTCYDLCITRTTEKGLQQYLFIIWSFHLLFEHFISHLKDENFHTGLS